MGYLYLFIFHKTPTDRYAIVFATESVLDGDYYRHIGLRIRSLERSPFQTLSNIWDIYTICRIFYMFSLAPQLSTRHCSRLLLSAVLRLPIDLLPAGRSAANPPHAAAAVDRRDRQMDARPFHKPCSAYDTGTVRNIQIQKLLYRVKLN